PIAAITRPVLYCDHCSAPDPAWSYRTSALRTVAVTDADTVVHDFGERYAACLACAAHIDAGDRAGLRRRARAAYRTHGLDPAAAAGLDALQHEFWAGLRPGRTALAEGPTVSVGAPRPGMLPRVRDRLHDWYSSDAPARTSWLQPDDRPAADAATSL